MIEVQDLEKQYPGHPPVIKGVSFHLKPRQILAVIGRSGSGKSTMLDVIMGLQKPTNGSVVIRQNIRLGYVFQRPALLPWAKVWQNIALPLRINRIPKHEILLRVDRALAQVGLSYARELLPSQLSGGMAQRVAIARALVQTPDILLMDEPFSALDPILRENMNINLLKLWQASQTSIIFVTHSIEEAVILSDRVFILEGGQFIADFEITLDRPRTFDTFKTKAFAEQVREIHQKLPDQPNLPRKLETSE